MDDAVIAALAKWPNVPACYGWLTLDRRGRWRLGQNGGKLVDHRGLATYLHRNYGADDCGAWFCQNGPQRVYVALENCPFVIRVGANGELSSQGGGAFAPPDAAWIDAEGCLYLESEGKIGIVDDRDLPDILANIVTFDGHPARDDEILALCSATPAASRLYLLHLDARLPLRHSTMDALADRFGFIRTPTPIP